jgi:hypothetical protein
MTFIDQEKGITGISSASENSSCRVLKNIHSNLQKMMFEKYSKIGRV